MRNLDKTILRTLAIMLAGGGLVIACTSSNPVDPNADGGPADGTLPDGAPAVDGDVPDSVAPKTCEKGEDCPSGLCNLVTKLCEPSNCKDGAKNGNETDLDCGGDCSPCDTGKTCAIAKDCAAGVCKDVGKGLECQAPSNTDGVKNGLETGIDCGGAGNNKCPDGQGCKSRDDCNSDYCKAGLCTAIVPGDGEQNGNETDIDCGGVGNARCDDNLKCLVPVDCKSSVCTDVGAGLRCQPPTYTDGVKNGTETDIDCGGDPTRTYTCTTGQDCLAGDDCSSRGCNYLFKCAAGRSCTNPGGYGTSTCGLGGEGRAEIIAEKNWEDCCIKLPVTPTSGPTSGQQIMLDKYQVTAGRMRVFLESVGYNVRAFVQNKRDVEGTMPTVPGDPGHFVLEPAWDMHLPTSFAGNTDAGEVADCTQGQTTTPTGNTCNGGTQQAGLYTGVRRQLGGTVFKGNDQTLVGCGVGNDDGSIGGGTHAFRFPDGMHDGTAPKFDQNIYDTKSMQCIPYLLAQAFCVWDGGRLNLGQEWVAAWGPGPASQMPWVAQTARTPEPQGSSTYWGCRFPWATDADQAACGLPWNAAVTTLEYANYQYSYEYPKLVGFDYIVFIAAPGRTRGRGPAGHADVIGNNYSLTSNVVYNADPFVATHGWNASGTWEVHGYSKPTTGLSRTSNLLNKYGKLGLRCAYP